MTGDKNRPGIFRDVRARALRVRIDALENRLDEVLVLCEVAEKASAPVAAETLERARMAFDRILEQLSDARHVSARDADGLQGKITEIKAKLLHAGQRLRELRGERASSPTLPETLKSTGEMDDL